MLLFINTDLVPGGETVWEIPARDSEADALKYGDARILRTPESGGKQVGGAKWRRGGSHCDRESGLSNVGGWGKISSRGERWMGGWII